MHHSQTIPDTEVDIDVYGEIPTRCFGGITSDRWTHEHMETQMHKTYSKVLLSRGPVNALNKSLDNISTFIVSIYTSFWIERTSRSV